MTDNANNDNNENTERDVRLGAALRSLTVDGSRDGFWDDVERDLHHADLAQNADSHSLDGRSTDGLHEASFQSMDSAAGGAPAAGSAQARANRRWTFSPSVIMAVAAAVLIVVGGFVWALRPQDDQTTELQVAGQDEPAADGDNDVSVPDAGETSDAESDPTEVEASTATPAAGDTSTNAAPPRVDLGQISSPRSLPLMMEPVAGSETSDVTLFSWDLFGNSGAGCEGFGGTRALVALDSNGVQVARLAASGLAPTIVQGPGTQIALAEWCEGDVQSVQVGSFAESGAVRIDRWLIAPDGFFFSRFDPVWSADGEQLLVHLQDSAGVLWLGTFDAETGDVEVEQATGRVLAQLTSGVSVLATSRSVSVGDQQLMELDPDQGGASLVQVEVSPDGRHVAIAENDQVVVTDADGEWHHYVTGGDSIWAMDWSPTGQLAISTAGTPSMLTYDVNRPGEFSPVSGLEGDWFAIEFADGGKTLSVFGILAADPTGQPQTQVIRLVPGSAVEREPQDPFGTLAQTVGEQPLALRGIGVIESGMTVAEAEAAVGGRLIEFAPLGGCSHAVLAGDPKSPSFMVITYREGDSDLEWSEGIISRIEIGGDQATLSGIGIGSTKAEVLAAYGDRIEVTGHHYTHADGGEYLTFVPLSEEDSEYRVVMETFDDTVTAVRSGLLPAVEFVEGCA